ncbi:MAG: hypothetical protein KIT84_08930 [Labilithrix sp.]|nr:hypothetical protein [Labilithrix sp.]MCW5811123.1 hypothetical protein [Labilithrix sp.]
MRPFHVALVALALALAACGGETEPVSTPAPAPSKSERDEASAAHARTTLVLRNASDAPRWVALDMQQTPIDFEIGTPPLQLNGYGHHWCDGPKWNHNDPAFYSVQIDPGAEKPIHWQPISVTREGDCWRGTNLAPGSYAVKVCSFDEIPPLRNMNEKPEGLRCTDRTLTLPASGGDVLVDL